MNCELGLLFQLPKRGTLIFPICRPKSSRRILINGFITKTIKNRIGVIGTLETDSMKPLLNHHHLNDLCSRINIVRENTIRFVEYSAKNNILSLEEI